MARIRPSLCSLPPELIEEVIIISTLLGDTRAAATLALTCRDFRILVYHQSHHRHLWRQMFLALFDNPCPARAVRTYGRAPWLPIDLANTGKGKSKNRPAVQGFPWEDEYKLRIWTESFILRRTRPPADVSRDLPSTDDELYTALETLLRVISTAAPLPYDTLAHIASHYQTCCPPQPHPIFSPVFVAAHTRPALVLRSHNTTWLARVLEHGLPRELMARLTAFDENGLVNVQKEPVKWGGLLAKLVAQIGLMVTPSAERSSHDTKLYTPLIAGPVDADSNTDADPCGGVSSISKTPIGTSAMQVDSEVEGDDDDADNRDETMMKVCWSADHLSSDDGDDEDFVPHPEDGDEGESASERESDEESESVIDGDEVLGTRATSATTSQDGLRRLARVRVYNMAYLRPSRAFGPFLPVNSQSASSSATQKPGSSATEGENTEDAMGSPSIVAPPVPPIPDTNFFLRALAGAVDGADLDDSDSLLLIEDADGGGDNDDNDERDLNVDPIADGAPPPESPEGGQNVPSSITPASPAVALTPSSGSSVRRAYGSDIPGDQLRFDWAWIAAARQVIELNLRDLLMGRHQAVLRALLSLDGLRACSAPGFPPVAPPGSLDEHAHESESGPVFEDGEGWDWAGVEGQWRRCVCWLDYRDLLGNNAQPLEKRFNNPALYEVMRIIPLTLRITHYTRAPAAWPGRPTIHVTGDWHTTTTQPHLARVRGTVEMAASGDVRWTLISFREDGQGQWASEGVQLGGRGSAMGVIGLWTGAEHELSDPLGPFWAWKVGPLNVDGDGTTVGGARAGDHSAEVGSSTRDAS